MCLGKELPGSGDSHAEAPRQRILHMFATRKKARVPRVTGLAGRGRGQRVIVG